MNTRINVLCEGTSEERFVKDILTPFFEKDGLYMKPITLGGVSGYGKIKKELKRIGKDTSSYLTTMLDYYGLPQDVPGVKESHDMDIKNIGSSIEASIRDDMKEELSCRGFIPYIMMHEYEALLFSDVNAFARCDGMTEKKIKQLQLETAQYPTPEHINNSLQTAPSKRILRVYDRYQKVSDGIMIAEEIGLKKMMEKCKHFSWWIETIKSLRQ